MTSKFLTPKQKQVLDFIQGYQREKGYAPAQREIAAHFGLSSLGTVQHYLNQLTELGHLNKSWNARRGLSVSTEDHLSIHSLPLLGKVAAGRPIEAVQSEDWVEVPASMIKKRAEHFVLKVQGDSMIEDGILDGDLVIVRKQEAAENGETVVALIENEATIKRYYKHQNRIELHPANAAYSVIHVEPTRKFKIEGVLAGLIRKMI